MWYNTSADNDMKLGTLCLMCWGEAFIWFVDAVVEYIEEGAAYFTPTAADMLNDAFWRLSAVAFGLVIWLVVVLIKEPKGRIRDVLTK
ncbi:MAG: hypothetical protein ACI4DP_08435 [Candidatus Ornithomonoglobus sp.]